MPDHREGRSNRLAEAACSELFHDEALEFSLLTPAGEVVEKSQRPTWIHGLEEASLARPLAFVITRRAHALIFRQGLGPVTVRTHSASRVGSIDFALRSLTSMMSWACFLSM
jgi:hypothetical protein